MPVGLNLCFRRAFNSCVRVTKPPVESRRRAVRQGTHESAVAVDDVDWLHCDRRPVDADRPDIKADLDDNAADLFVLPPPVRLDRAVLPA